MDRTLNEYEKLTKRLLELIKEHRIGITSNDIEIKKIDKILQQIENSVQQKYTN
jgi:hypothetical protein